MGFHYLVFFIRQLAGFVKHIVRYVYLAWYDKKITTAMVEGINNKIKVMKREAYGFTDDRYFELRLLALHDAGITSFL